MKDRASAAKRRRAVSATSVRRCFLALARSTSFLSEAVASVREPAALNGSMTFSRFPNDASCASRDCRAAASRSAKERACEAAVLSAFTFAFSSAKATRAASRPNGSERSEGAFFNTSSESSSSSSKASASLFFADDVSVSEKTASSKTPPAASREDASRAAAAQDADAFLAFWEATSSNFSFSLAHARTWAISSSSGATEPVKRAVAAAKANSDPSNSAEYIAFGNGPRSRNSRTVRDLPSSAWSASRRKKRLAALAPLVS
mmetsp:Transcript_7321/g.22544  ORF Transcript_7321/g.22544 Transcript_7321/m.22544 type:complete len:262 (-) Transcript_7321:352-1137(-)